MVNLGDYVRTPRFCTVRISAVFETARQMREAGYTEPTYYEGDLDIRGKSIGINRMIFAAAPKDAR